MMNMLAILLSIVLILPATAQPLADTKPAVQIPSATEVMALPEGLREEFQRNVLDTTSFPEARLERLVKFVFDRDGLGIAYKPNVTRTISEIYRERTVNCLSSTLLIVALAREAGLKAQGQRVHGVLTWSEKGGVAIQSQHANAIITVSDKRRFIVDVDAGEVLATDAIYPVDDNQLLAYFYGNRAMELLVTDHQEDAKYWMAEALKYSANDATLLNNAGVLNLRSGELDAAEQMFLRSAELDAHQPSVLANLVGYYQRTGNVKQEIRWKTQSDRVLMNAPYYQYQLGVNVARSGDAAASIVFFKRAIRLNRKERRFHIALAKAYMDVGRVRKARSEINLARALALSPDQYDGDEKLTLLRDLHW